MAGRPALGALKGEAPPPMKAEALEIIIAASRHPQRMEVMRPLKRSCQIV